MKSQEKTNMQYWKLLILPMQFLILWFFGIIAFGYALSLTDTFSALIIWVGGGMCYVALVIIRNLFKTQNTQKDKK